MNTFEEMIIYVGIDLSCLNRRMPKQCLNGSNIGSFLEQRSGKRMSQRMRRDFLFVSGKLFTVAIFGKTDNEWFIGISSQI